MLPRGDAIARCPRRESGRGYDAVAIASWLPQPATDELLTLACDAEYEPVRIRQFGADACLHVRIILQACAERDIRVRCIGMSISRKHNKVVGLPLTEAEHQALRLRAIADNCSISNYLRRLLRLPETRKGRAAKKS